MTAFFIGSTGLLLIIAAGFLWQLGRAYKRFRIRKTYTAAIEAPSVSVCIPARNETHAMTQCLERVLASDYAKMEIIVFDDSSSDDTSALVRSFAYAGVRFVSGTALPAGWLGKNHALDILAREASGSYIIFLDVDTAITHTTISRLVSYTVTEKADMVSVIPTRNDTWRASVLFGTLRYFWQLVLSRASSPASSGSLWLIKRDTLLKDLGGMETYKSNIQPEASMAARLGTEKYHALISNEALGVSYEKRWQSQVETSQRLLYPLAGGTWWSALAAIVFLLVLNVPFGMFLLGIIGGFVDLQVAGLLLTSFYMAIYGSFTYHTWRNRWWTGALLWPLIILQELYVFIYSVIGYARGTITWKNRPVVANVAKSAPNK